MSTTRRNKQRGAAMVEAALVFPALITCFGVIMLAGGARHVKLAQQQLARQGVLSYATDACQSGRAGAIGGSGGDPGVTTPGSGPSNPSQANSGNGTVDTGIGDALNNTANQTSKSFGTASGGPGAENWSYNHAYVNSSVSVTGHSFYFCNEKGWGRWNFFGYAVNFVTQFLP